MFEPVADTMQHEIIVFWKGADQLEHLLFASATIADEFLARRNWIHAWSVQRIDRVWSNRNLGTYDWCRVHTDIFHLRGNFRFPKTRDW